MSATHECAVCWRPYDPDEGDDRAGVAPGTSFADLPAHWCCPDCEAPKARFLALIEEGPREGLLRRALETGYRRVAEAMEGLPVVNPHLCVEIGAVRPCGAFFAAALVTPWAINLLLLPRSAERDAPQIGTEHDFDLPSGTYGFIATELPEAGCFWQLSLFSPPSEFADQAAALLAAESALDALLAAPAPRAVDRRQIFGLRA